MSAHATITFSQPGVQGPIYVVTDLSSPPWEPLDMKDSGEKSESGDPIFVRDFEGDISEGPHQYKIRIGHGHWFLDTSKETVSDNAGNLNNVVRAAVLDTAQPQSSQQELQEKKERQDSVFHAADTPFVVVSKVPDVKQPTYGDVEPDKLPQDAAKRIADADPDYESVLAEPSVEQKSKGKEVEIPTVIVEKVDPNPTHGDDFGERATSAQKEAHKARAADAQPDRVVLNPNGFESYDNDFELAPQFSHEDGQSSKRDEDHGDFGLERAPAFSHELGSKDTSMHTSAMTNAMDTVPEPPLESEEPELATPSNRITSDETPLLPHEMDDSVATSNSAGDETPLLPHERDVVNELENAPVLPHEAGNGAADRSKRKPAHLNLDVSDYEMSELDRSPSLSHEMSSFNGRSDPAPLLPYEVGTMNADEGSELERGLRLLHEHSFAASKMEDRNANHSPSQESHDDGVFIGNRHMRSQNPMPPRSSSSIGSGQSSPGFKRSGSNTLLGSNMRGSIAPGMPHSDAEDEDLKVAGYEVFPTKPEEILVKLSGIARRLSREDVSDGMQYYEMSSPEIVPSQACSVVDLSSVRSHSSLTAIREAVVPEEAEESDSDGSSPLEMTGGRDVNSGEGDSATDGTSGVDLASTTDGDHHTNTTSSLHTANTTISDAKPQSMMDELNVPLIDRDNGEWPAPVDDRSMSSASLHDAERTIAAKGKPNTFKLDVVSGSEGKNGHSKSGGNAQEGPVETNPQTDVGDTASTQVHAGSVQRRTPDEQPKEPRGLFAAFRRIFTGCFGLGQRHQPRSLAVLAVVVGLLWYWWV